jgi:hypothetical protein
MKKLEFAIFVCIALLLAACSQQSTKLETPEEELNAQANSWQKLGGVLDATIDKSPMGVVMLLDRTEKPVVASLEDDNKGNYKVYFQKWTGTAWQTFAPSLVVSRNGYLSFDFQIDLKNRPVVAVEKNTAGGLEDVVYRYENGSWKQLGDPSNAPNLSPFIDLVIAPNGNIFALVSDNAANKSLIRRWNGATWQTLYTYQKVTTVYGETITHRASSLLFTKTSRPVVTWQLTSDESPYASTPEFYTEVWNDLAWVKLHEYGFWGEIILDKNDKVLEAYIGAQESSSSSCGMSVSQGGTSLPELGDATKSSSYDLAVDSGNRPVVAHTIRCALGDNNYGWPTDAEEANQDLVVRRWSGSSWQTLGSVVDRIANKGASSEALAIDSKNTVYALFTQCATFGVSGYCTNRNLYLSKYIP